MNDIPPPDQLKAQAERVRQSGVLGRSGVMVKLFDFLLARSASGDIPKEVEVAFEVFGKDPEFDAMQDSSVRVYIYRLRRKLDEFYASADGPRLFIPRGEYRISVAPAEAVPNTPDEAEDALVPSKRQRLSPRWWAAIAAALLLVSIVGWAVVLERDTDPRPGALAAAPWSQLDARFPMYLVVGDYFIFGEVGDNGELSRLVREFAVNSREDLDEWMMFNPDMIGRYVDLDLNYLPTSAAAALHSLDPLVRDTGRSPSGPMRIVTASRLNADMIKAANIVYVGYLSGLGVLAAPVFGASHFGIGSSYDELVERGTGRRFLSDWSRVVDAKTPTRDYGYLASIPGPAGSRILIVAGTRDAGLLQTADIAANPEELKRIAARTKGAPAFEALYEVQTLGNTNLGSRLIAAYPLDTRRVWQDISRAQDDLPDRLPER